MNVVTPDEWNKKHKLCPKCKSDHTFKTLAGPIWDTSKDYEDNINSFECWNCGCKGKVKELVGESE